MKTDENTQIQPKKKRIFRALLTVFCALFAAQFLLHPIVTMIVYESIFSMRFEPVDWMEFSTSEFENLTVERSDFQTENGEFLAGFCYAKTSENETLSDMQSAPKGVVVFAHGLGCGGHNFYLPFIDYFTDHGYLAFAYDATGNGESGGENVIGLPQAVVDLDYALRHIKTVAAYQNLPVVLFGHSWGGYAAGSVLNFHKDIQAVALLAAFNESEDQLLYQSMAYVGGFAKFGMPFVTLHERVKFGKKYTDATVVNGLKNSDAAAVIAHSQDDPTVPPDQGYGKLLKAFQNNERFQFISFEDKGHERLLFSDAALSYRDEIEENYEAFVAENGGKPSAQLKREYMLNHLDKKRCFQPNGALMQTILTLYDSRCIS